MLRNISQFLYSVGRQYGQQGRRVLDRFTAGLSRTPLPRVLIVLAAIALVLSLLPFVLMLILAAMLFRLSLHLMGVRRMQEARVQPQQRPSAYEAYDAQASQQNKLRWHDQQR